METDLPNPKMEVAPTAATSRDSVRSTADNSSAITHHLVWTMAVACGLSEANLIYAQPLLADMGRSFGVSIDQIGLTSTLCQLGYAVGLLFIVPLGEKYNQRHLIVMMLCAVAMSLVAMAVAPLVSLLIFASCVVGLTSITPELIIPFAARLASPNERGRIVGTVLCGLFIGTPLASMLSGFVGKHLGWQAMYWIAAAIMLVLAVVLRFVLPDDRTAKHEVSYLQLVGSLWELFRSEVVLQEISVFGVLVFGAFSAFWVTLAYSLETPPYHYGSDVVGIFGLVGIVGGLAGLFVGRFTDHGDARYANGVALLTTLLSFVVMWLTDQWLIGLIISALLLSVGAQSNQVASEARIYLLQAEAWNRLNTIYIFLFCIGGSLGSMLGILGWSIAGRNGTYSVACLMLVVALGFYVLHGRRVKGEKAMGLSVHHSIEINPL